MATAISRGPFDFEAFCVVTGEQKADLIDGVIYLTPLDTPADNRLFTFLMGLVGDFVEAKHLGRVFVLGVAFRLDRWNAPEPDIAFVARSRLARVRREYVAGPPDLAVEIVTHESMHRDYRLKRAQYARAGVKEYWIIDPIRKAATVLLRDENGSYRAARARNGVLHSRVLPGLWLRPEWLWRKPRPRLPSLLDTILAGPKPRHARPARITRR